MLIDQYETTQVENVDDLKEKLQSFLKEFNAEGRHNMFQQIRDISLEEIHKLKKTPLRDKIETFITQSLNQIDEVGNMIFEMIQNEKDPEQQMRLFFAFFGYEQEKKDFALIVAESQLGEAVVSLVKSFKASEKPKEQDFSYIC